MLFKKLERILQISKANNPNSKFYSASNPTYVLVKNLKILSKGTIKEIAKDMGVLKDTIYLYHSPAYKKRCSKNNNKKKLYSQKQWDEMVSKMSNEEYETYKTLNEFSD